MDTVRVVVLDRRRALREVLTALLSIEPGIEVVAAVTRAAEMPSAPDAFDITLLGVADEPQRGWADTAYRVLHFTDRASIGDLVDAVLGRVTPDTVQLQSAPASRLTPRQRHVLQGVADGLRSDQIAATLGISRRSVENHKQRIFAKLGVQSQAHAVAVALEAGSLLRPGGHRQDGLAG